MKFFNVITTTGLGTQQDLLKQAVIPLGQAQVSISANPLNGNVLIKDFSKTFVELGFSFDMGYQYNSQSKTPWRLTQGKTVRPVQGQLNTLHSPVILEESDGHESTYQYDEVQQCYVNLASNNSGTQLTYTKDGQWISWDPLTNIREFYNTKNQLEKICDASGNYLHYQYDEAGRLSTIGGKSGKTISIEYDAQTVRIYSLEGKQKKLEMRYEFNEANRLKNTIIPLNDQENYVTHYEYALDSKCLSHITQSDETEVHFEYKKIENRYQLHAVSQNSLSQDDTNTYLFDYQKNNTTLTDMLGQQEQFAINDAGLLWHYSKTSPLQTQSQTYAYDVNGRFQSIQYEDGTAEQWSYDALGCCSQIINRNGEITRFYRDKVTGLLQCETQVQQNTEGPVSLNTFYCYNDTQELVYKILPHGAVEAFVYDVNGNCLSQKSFRDNVLDVSQFTQDSPILTSTVREWCEQQNQAAITLTEWSYNDLGQKISQTAYANINPYGAGIDDAATGYQQFFWDKHGNLLEEQTRLNGNESAIKTVDYDGLARPITESNLLGQTKHIYQSNQHQTIFVPTGLTTTTTWNKSGNVICQTKTAENLRSENQLTYDTAERLCMIEQQQELKEYIVYDAFNRKLFTIDAAQRVIQYLYDTNNNLTHQLRFKEPIQPLTLIDEAALQKGTWRPTLSSNYCIESTYYDPCGRLRYEINGDNFVIEHRYDTVGNRIETIAYATALTPLQRDEANLSPALSNADRHHRYFYNEAHLLIGEQLPSGHVVAYELNPQGEILKKRTTLAALPRLNTWYIDEATAVTEERFELDARGQCLFFSNTEQQVTKQTWDAAGRQSTQTVGDETIAYAWDACNRKTQESHSTGLTIHKTYAACGKIARETQLDTLDNTDKTDNLDNPKPTDFTNFTTSSTARSSHLRYNGFGQVTHELSPRVTAKLNNAGLAVNQSYIENLWEQESIQHQYNALGLKISTQDEQKNTTYFYYNAAQELCFTISATGSLTEFTYDAMFHKINSTRDYAIQLTETERAFLTGGMLTDELTDQFHAKQTPDDAINRVDYNLRGLSELEVDPEQYTTKTSYDAFNNPYLVERQIDRDQVVIDQIEYDKKNRPIKKTQDIGGIEAIESWKYVDRDQLVIHTDANHNADKTYVDTLKRTIKTIDALGNETLFAWDALSRLSNTTDPEGKVTTVTYENHGRKIIKKTPLSISTIEKNAFGEVIREQNADQAVWEKVYDVDGQIKTTIDPNGNEQHYAYNNVGWLTAVVDPLQHMTCYEHNQSGQIIKQIEKGLSENTAPSLLESGQIQRAHESETKLESNDHVMIFQRDAQGREILRIDANGIETQTIYDKRGLEIAKIIDPAGLALSVSHGYDGLKNIVKEIKGDSKDPNQRTIHIQRDKLGRELTKVVDPDGLQITTGALHDKAGNRIASIDANQHTTHYCFDAAHRERYLIDPMGGVIEKIYDKNGRCIEARHYATTLDMNSIIDFTLAKIETLVKPGDTDQVVYHAYDADNRETACLDNFGQLITFEYNAQGKKTHEIQYALPSNHTDFIESKLPAKSPQDRRFAWFYDKLGNERFTINGEGIVTENRWNEKGWLVEERTYATTYFDYATCPNREKLVHPDDRATQYMHDAFGRVIFEINAEGHVTEYGYDNGDKPIKIWCYPDKIGLPQAMTLDTIRNLLPSCESVPNTQISYDAADRKITAMDELQFRETFELDALNNLRNYTDKGGDSWTFDFDAAGRKIAEATPPVISATVNADGLLTQSDTLARVTKKIEYIGDIERFTEAYGTPDARTMELHYNACQKVTHTVQAHVLVDALHENESINHDKTETLITTTYFNAFQKPIVTLDEAGNIQFRVYKADQLRYEVDPEGFVTAYDYNLFGNVIKLTRHAIAFDPDLMAIAATAASGLSLSDMTTHLQESDQDRHLYFTYDNANRPTKTEQDAVWIYSPQRDSDAKYGQFSPVTINEYNAFGEIHCERKLVDPLNDAPERQWDVTRKWFNHAGYQTAEINGLNYLTIFTPDRRGNNETIIEYAKQLVIPFSAETTVTEILQAQILDPEQDRVFKNQFNARGDLVKTIQQDVQLYDTDALFDSSAIAGLSTEAKQSIETFYERNAKGLITQTLLPNGAIKNTQYDARNLPILKTEPLRHLELMLTATPVTTITYNAFAQPVCLIRHANPYEKQAYLEPHPDDQRHVTGYDTRGLQMVSVDPEGAVRFQRFTATKKLARTWLSVTGWGENATSLKRLHQTTYAYDKRGIETEHCESIEGGDVITTATLSNAFGEKTAEGSGDGLFPMVWLHDKTGAVWKTNEQSGVPTIILHNAQGQETATLRSRTHSLQAIDNDAALREMLTWDYRDLQRLELFRDVQGRIEAQSLPAFKTLKPDAPEPYLTEITSGSFYAQFGAQSLSWPTPDIAGLTAKVSLWPQGRENEIYHLTPVMQDGREGVDVSQLSTDDYQYQIDFYYTDPQTGQQDGNPRYRAEGSTFIITEHLTPTNNVIWQQIDDQHLMLYGNVQNVSGVELLDAGKSVARVSVNSTDKPNCWRIDFSDQPSGQYEFRLLYGYELLEQEPVAVGVPSANGTRIDFIRTELSHSIRLNSMSLDAFVTSSWRNLPPQITNLQQELTVINAISNVSSTQSMFTTYSMETATLYLSLENLSSEKTFHNKLKYLFYDFCKFSSTVSQNKLYTIDKAGKSWPIAEIANPLHAISHPNPSYLYVQPGSNIQRVDSLREHVVGDTTRKTFNMSQWLNQSSRCLASDAMRYPAYELISLKASVPGKDIAGVITTHTANLRSNRLIVREIPLKKISSSKISTIFDNAIVSGYHLRDALNFQWSLPDDLNTNLLKVNVQLKFSDPIYIKAYGTQYNFEYCVGRSSSTPFNGHLLASMKKYQPGFSMFELAHLKLQLQWGEDWIPLLDSNDFTTDRAVTRKPFSFVLGVTIDKNEIRNRYSNEYFEGDVSTFSDTYTLLFYPLPPNIADFKIDYWDTTLSTPKWQPIANATFTGHAIAAPAGPIPIGTFQYRIRAEDANEQPIALATHAEQVIDGWMMGEMTVRHGGSLSVVSQSIRQEEVVKPFRQQTLDRWQNVTSSTPASRDPSHTTYTQYNGRNQPLTKTEPSIDVTDENGISMPMTPKTHKAYDRNDQVIAVSDPNRHVMIHERDNDGKTLKTIRADGVFKVFLLDIFGRTKTIRDPLHHDTNYRYDRCDREILRTDACLWETSFSHNEQGDRLSVTNGNKETERYDYLHPGRQPTHHYLPGGDHYLTQTDFDRNHRIIYERLPEGGENTWETDYFGNVLSHIDLGGVKYTYTSNVFYPSEISKVESSEGALSLKALAKKKTATLAMNQTAEQTSKTRQSALEQYQTASVRKLLYRMKDYLTKSNLTKKRQEIADVLASLVSNLSDLPHAKTDKLLLDLIDQLQQLRDKNNQISRAHGKRENSGRLHKQIESFLQESQAIHALQQSIDNHGGHGARLSWDGTSKPMPSQAITYQHDEASHLVAILDDALPLRTFYRFDQEERRARETFIASDGHIHQAVFMKWNAMNWLTEVQDTVMQVKFRHDLKGNRRATIAKIYVENGSDSGWHTVGDENWYTFTAADNMHICRGKFKDGKIQQGTVLLYDIAGRRHHELTMQPDSLIMIDKTLFYLDNDLLSYTESTNGEINRYDYDNHVARRSVFSTKTTTHTSEYDINGRVILETFKDTAQHVHSTTTLTLDHDGLPHHQTTNLLNDAGTDGYEESLETSYVEFDSERVSEIAGTLHRMHGDTTTSSVKTGYDPNGFTEIVIGANQEIRSFITNSEGRIVQKKLGHDKKESYFYTTDNQPLGRFGNIPQELLRSALRNARQLTSDDIKADFDLNYHPVSENFPPPAPTTCVVVNGDTFERISERMYGDKSFANLIADTNGYRKQDNPPVGLSLQVPSIVNTNLHNWQGQYSIYNPAAIVGSLHPNMTMPSRPISQPKHVSFWHVFVEAILSATLMAFAPELAGALAGVLGQLLGQGLGFALAGAASSLTQQGLALGFGDQQGLSWKAIGEGALLSMGTAGIAKGIGMDLTKMPNYKGFLDAATKNIELTLATQGLSYATGQQRHFDWRVMLASVANTLANVGAKQINFGAPAFNDAVATASATVASIGIDGLLGQRIDSETIAANTLGTFIGNQIAAQAKQHYAQYQAQKTLEAQDTQNAFHIPEISESLEQNKREFIQSVKAHPHAHGGAAFSTPSSQARAQSQGRGSHSVASGKVSHSSKPNTSKTANDSVYAASPNHHLKAERAEQEAQMNRSARWNAANNRATTSAHGFWGMVDSAANSRVVSDIITAGDAVRDTLGSGLNKIGKDILRAGSEISEASRALGSGELGLGLSVAGSAAWDLLPFVPLEGAVVKGVEYGVRGVSALTAKVGLFGERTAVGAKSLALRQRVLGNIAESRAATEVSNFPVLAAKEDQILGGYKVDDWTMTTLKKGDAVYGGLPGQSNYYTTVDSILAANGNRQTLGELLQVIPHPEKGYRPNVGEYVLTKDVRIPMGATNANPHLGVGNCTQFFINRHQNMLRLNNEYTLENLYELNMSRNQYRY